MPAQIIDGKALSAEVRARVRQGVEELRARRGVVPGLAAVRVGDDPASEVYVRNKVKASAEVGIRSAEHHLPATSEPDLLALIARLNADPEVHAILVQLPLPEAIDSARVIEAISPAKDVDGLHPLSAGALFTGRPGPRPCTPAGILRLLEHAGAPLEGARAVVIGRSNLVGKPVAMLLLERHATVTLCHTRTRDLASEVGRADVLVVAAGRPAFVKGNWVKPGAYVIDVGVNRMADGRLVGDVEFEPARERAAAITPVPGGVGPMTVAMLLENTLSLARAQARDAP